jgi:hypothetical protein
MPDHNEYTAIIWTVKDAFDDLRAIPPVRLARSAPTRIEAVRQVWDAYNDCKNKYHENQMHWMYQFALGDVELQIIKNRRKQ